MAEATVVKEALRWIDVINWPKVILESDCLVVVQAICSKTPIFHFGLIIEECRRLLTQLCTPLTQLAGIEKELNFKSPEAMS